MGINRTVLHDSELENLESAVIGQFRIWREGTNGQPNTPTEFWLVFTESAPGARLAGRVIQGDDVQHVDDRTGNVFRGARVNVLDYGPAFGRSFTADLVLRAGVVDRITA